jgi:tetratricopeptide (TPR) repeat protein
MADTIEWNHERRQQQTALAELNHARLYLSKAQQWSAKFTTAEAPDNLRAMDAKIGNIETALQRTADPDQLNQPELARDLAVTLYDYYDKRCRWDDWVRLGPLGLEASQRLGDTYSLGEAYPAICNGLGIVHRMLNNLKEAMKLYEQALRRAARDELKSDALTNMADIHRLRGESEQALQCAQQAVELGQQAGDKDREAKGLEYMGLMYTSLKEYDKAIECHERALRLREETGNLPRVALALDFLSAALTERGSNDDLKRALVGYQRAYEIETQLENQQGLARCYVAIGKIYSRLGEYKKAIEYFQMASGFQSEIAFLRGVAVTHIELAYAYLRSGGLEQGVFHTEEASKYRQHLLAPDRVLRAPEFCQALLGTAEYFEQRDVEQAEDFAQIAIEFATEAKESVLLERAKQLQQRLTQRPTQRKDAR